MIICGGYPSGPTYDHPGYIGPSDLLERYRRGEVVTRTDALLDQSEWIIVPASEFSDHDRDRLRWMTEHLSRDETNNAFVSQTVQDGLNIAHADVPRPGIAHTDRIRPCPK